MNSNDAIICSAMERNLVYVSGRDQYVIEYNLFPLNVKTYKYLVPPAVKTTC
jgi:hypothetical protein